MLNYTNRIIRKRCRKCRKPPWHPAVAQSINSAVVSTQRECRSPPGSRCFPRQSRCLTGGTGSSVGARSAGCRGQHPPRAAVPVFQHTRCPAAAGAAVVPRLGPSNVLLDRNPQPGQTAISAPATRLQSSPAGVAEERGWAGDEAHHR